MTLKSMLFEVKILILLSLTMLALPSIANSQVFEISPMGEIIVVSGGLANIQTENGNKSDNIKIKNKRNFTSPMPEAWTDLFIMVAQKNNIDPLLLEALVYQESRWNPSAISPKGAIGLTQLMPATAMELGVNPYDPLENLDGGARYLRIQLDKFNGDLNLALAAYNAGEARVRRAGGVPPIRETIEYVNAIRSRINNGK